MDVTAGPSLVSFPAPPLYSSLQRLSEPCPALWWEEETERYTMEYYRAYEKDYFEANYPALMSDSTFVIVARQRDVMLERMNEIVGTLTPHSNGESKENERADRAQTPSRYLYTCCLESATVLAPAIAAWNQNVASVGPNDVYDYALGLTERAKASMMPVRFNGMRFGIMGALEAVTVGDYDVHLISRSDDLGTLLTECFDEWGVDAIVAPLFSQLSNQLGMLVHFEHNGKAMVALPSPLLRPISDTFMRGLTMYTPSDMLAYDAATKSVRPLIQFDLTCMEHQALLIDPNYIPMRCKRQQLTVYEPDEQTSPEDDTDVFATRMIAMDAAARMLQSMKESISQSRPDRSKRSRSPGGHQRQSRRKRTSVRLA